MKRHWLIQLRKGRNLTQDQVANLDFINRAYYAQIENGKRQPSITVAKNIAQILGFIPSTFFMEEMQDPFQIALKIHPLLSHIVTWNFGYTGFSIRTRTLIHYYQSEKRMRNSITTPELLV